ncbi:MAG: N-6 DNA methylase [Candidatus Bathyarchaeota archaeon]|nr:N-6 DNA methylase [Candidatus Bathyarchaeota archaeon]
MSVNQFSLVIKDHVAKSRSANTHPAKLLVLSSLLKELFGVKLEELIPGVESKLGSKLWGLRGSADLLFSNVVFEIKVDLKVEHDAAKEQLTKYFQLLHEKEPQRKHIGIATDVVEFVAYIPVMKQDKVVDLSKIGSIDIADAASSESVLWLDSFIFSKPKIRPSAMDLRWRFGPDSPTYCVSVDGLTALWEEVKGEKDVKLKLDLWSKNMEIVYGGRPEVSSFIDHTYLVTLVKLIVYLRLSGDNVVKDDRLLRALTGEYFASYGIANLIEEDFFAWMLHRKIQSRTLALVSDVTKELLRYDLSQIDEDFFKEIYQEIVKRSERHRIGEYYTPEWVVELALEESMELWESAHQGTPRILDPGCGSGTFLYNALHITKRRLLDGGKDQKYILDFVLDNIVGVDINPLAVVIARANYVVALGELLELGKRVIIPIYVADSVKIPKVTETLTKRGSTGVYEFSVEATNNEQKPKLYAIQIPKSVASEKTILSQVVEGYKAATNSYRDRRSRKEASEAFRRDLPTQLSDDELDVLSTTLNTILTLVDARLDAIWVFMLSNIYAPITLKQSKFDLVVGNPPWIAMRYIENRNYQDFLKERVLAYGLLDTEQVHLFTHMEMATLFFCNSIDLYLKENCIIAFVMPRSVLTGALHHVKFKEFRKPKTKLVKIFDFEDVSPLFNVPSCVLIGVKNEATSYPVMARRYAGTLDEKNIRLSSAIKQLAASDYMYEPPRMPTGRSWYHEKVREGATLVPRSLWFIDFDVHHALGVDTSRPLVETSVDVSRRAKEPWRGIELKGNVEADFLYATLLGGDIVPFGFSKMRSVVLPVEARTIGYRLIDVIALRNRGFVGTANWLEKAQKLWEERRTEKSRTRFPRTLGRLDYNGLLSIQNPGKRFVVLYNASGTNLVSCVIRRTQLPQFHILRARIEPKGFVADAKTWFYETNNEKEAYFICAVLNSNIVNSAIKPLQTRGLFGERDIHRRPFMMPIPKFEGKSASHLELAKLGMKCSIKIAPVQFKKKSVGGKRKEAMHIVAEEIKRIDELTSEFLCV